MIGYIFETTNLKTNEKYVGRNLSVKFDKNYLGDKDNDELAKDIEKYGRANFSAKMLMPFEEVEALSEVFASYQKPAKRVVESKPLIDEEEPKKRGRKRKVDEDE